MTQYHNDDYSNNNYDHHSSSQAAAAALNQHKRAKLSSSQINNHLSNTDVVFSSSLDLLLGSNTGGKSSLVKQQRQGTGGSNAADHLLEKEISADSQANELNLCALSSGSHHSVTNLIINPATASTDGGFPRLPAAPTTTTATKTCSIAALADSTNQLRLQTKQKSALSQAFNHNNCNSGSSPTHLEK